MFDGDDNQVAAGELETAAGLLYEDHAWISLGKYNFGSYPVVEVGSSGAQGVWITQDDFTSLRAPRAVIGSWPVSQPIPMVTDVSVPYGRGSVEFRRNGKIVDTDIDGSDGWSAARTHGVRCKAVTS